MSRFNPSFYMNMAFRGPENANFEAMYESEIFVNATPPTFAM